MVAIVVDVVGATVVAVVVVRGMVLGTVTSIGVVGVVPLVTMTGCESCCGCCSVTAPLLAQPATTATSETAASAARTPRRWFGSTLHTGRASLTIRVTSCHAPTAREGYPAGTAISLRDAGLSLRAARCSRQSWKRSLTSTARMASNHPAKMSMK